MALTYREIRQRCETVAQELMPALPKVNTLEAWESFRDKLESFDPYGSALFEVESWDWAIYTHYGIDVLGAIDSSKVARAESHWHEVVGLGNQDESFGSYEFASQVAFFALLQLLEEALYSLIQELQELAESEIENLQ